MALPENLLSALSISRVTRLMHTLKPFTALLALALCAGTAQARAQSADRVPQSFDPTPAAMLANQHPMWASPANDRGALDANKVIDNLTLILTRSPEQQQAFDQFVADQQNPASPNYHHWLTPVEIGTRFGLSGHDIDSISGWLESQGLHVNWVAPSRVFIAFGGSAASLGRAFGTEMHAYKVRGEDRISVSSDPRIPTALAPVIQAVRGLFTIQERPQHRSHVEVSDKPNFTIPTNSGDAYLIAPADFDTIYDVPTAGSTLGAGVTIGIVSESRTDMADFDNFKSLLQMNFVNPTEVIPVAYGGVDPGAAYTAPPTCETSNPPTCSSTVAGQIDLQGEATLDVLRSGSVAPSANLLLVVANSSSGGISDDAQYLTETTPVPAQIMSISFGGCESEDGKSEVDFWDNIYETGAAEGISTFVASGDGGAAGCDTYFTTPPTPAKQVPVSPNALCSSSYATCVGGTEFNDTADPSAYWNSTNVIGGSGLLSALSYIPEGAWNEPGDATNGFEVAATGGGVSQYIATPTWQTGTGVPAARAGRYTPDLAFSAAGHDAYFGCLSATQEGSCVSTSQGTPIVEFEGTSAAAPGMAGVAALLDQQYLGPQGNINPAIYTLATNVTSAFHDVTVATSGVASCSVGTPSMCNNSIPGPSSLTTGAETGYPVQTGYDEVTGWGSLDVGVFLNYYATEAGKITPTMQLTPSATSITTAQSLTVSVTVSGGSGNPAPTGTVTLSGGGYPSTAVALSSSTASFPIPAGTLAAGNDTLTAYYTPDSNSIGTYFTGTGTVLITVSLPTPVTPSVTMAVTSPVTNQENENLTVTVAKVGNYPLPSGNVTITSGTYTSSPTALSSGIATFTILDGTLPLGTNTVTAVYTPDTNGSLIYSGASATTTINVDPVQTPAITVSLGSVSINNTQSLPVTVTLGATNGFPVPSGQVTLTAGTYGTTGNLANGVVTFTIPAKTLAVGTDTINVAYAGLYDIYNGISGSATVSVTQGPDFTLSASPTTLSIEPETTGTTTVTVDPLYGFTGTVTLEADGLPDGVSAMFSAGTVLNTQVLTLTVQASAAVTSSPVMVSIKGTSNSLVETTTIDLSIIPIPTFGPAPGTGSANLSVAPGATTGNTVPVSVVGTNGFSGAVALNCEITASPAGANDPPTCSLSPTSVTISGSATSTSTLTVNTTASSSAENRMQKLFWPTTGGTALALLAFFITPRRRRNWLAMVALLVLFAAAGLTACGGGGGGGGGGGNPGTTTGTYTITVVGAANSGSVTAVVNTVTLTVN